MGWLFLVGALLLGGWVVRGVLLEQLRWRESFEVRLRTRDATGIWPGVHVTLSGYRIGRVDRVRLGPDGVVAVDLRIVARYRPLLGPRSRAYGTRPGVIGDSEIALTPDPLPPGASVPRTDLLLPYDPPTDVADLLQELAQTRLRLDRTLQGTLKVVEKDLPGAIGRFNGALDDVSRLAGTVERETGPTAAATRSTLAAVQRTSAAVERTGAAVEQVSRRGDQVLQDTAPLVNGTLGEIRRFTAGTNRLLQMFGSALLVEPPALPRAGGAPEPQEEPWQDRPRSQGRPPLTRSSAPLALTRTLGSWLLRGFGALAVAGLPMDPAAAAGGNDSAFLVKQAVDFYCGSMKGETPARMTDYDRGLFEGMAIGFVFGQYPSQADFVEKLGEERFNELFYGGIQKQCPGKAFDGVK